MKKNLRKILTVVCSLFIINCDISAQAFSATYVNDLNGNRIKETVIYLRTTIQSLTIPLDTVLKKDTLTRDTTVLPKYGWQYPSVDSASGMKISIYPNPTHGILLVEIGGVDQLSNGNNIIRAWDIQGKEVITIKPLNYYNTVDLSTQPNGVYVIGILVNGDNKTYKVIKN